jgi:hypothetical protein
MKIYNPLNGIVVVVVVEETTVSANVSGEDIITLVIRNTIYNVIPGNAITLEPSQQPF